MMTSLLNDGYATERKGEEWAAIPGYEGLYEASTLGRIRTAEGKTTHTERHGDRIWRQRILKPKWEKRKGSRGFKDARVNLWKDGKDSTLLVARLVALAWVPGYAEGLTVNHIDGNPGNNSADNLEWCTHAENIRKAYAEGQYTTLKPIVLRREGKETAFISMAAAGRALGRNGGYISDALRHNRPAMDIEGNVYEVWEA